MSTQLTKSSDELTIRAYFEGILKLAQSNEQYPVSLDEVWPLVYPRKDHAVRELTNNFIQDVDYQVFPKIGENPNGGRPAEEYRLTTACLEYFIARKVRPVFEVYRAVFHNWAKFSMPQDYLSALKALVVSEEARIAAEQEREEQRLIIAATKPKAEYCDKVLTSRSAMSVTTIAKEYGMSAVKFNQILAELHIQFKQSKQWFLYAEHDDKGYTESSTVTFTLKDGTTGTKVQTKWTQKGRRFLYEILKRINITPIRNPDND